MRDRVLRLYQWDAVAESYMRLVLNQQADYRPQSADLASAPVITEDRTGSAVTQDVCLGLMAPRATPERKSQLP
jgi:hypothetical protein